MQLLSRLLLLGASLFPSSMRQLQLMKKGHTLFEVLAFHVILTLVAISSEDQPRIPVAAADPSFQYTQKAAGLNATLPVSAHSHASWSFQTGRGSHRHGNTVRLGSMAVCVWRCDPSGLQLAESPVTPPGRAVAVSSSRARDIVAPAPVIMASHPNAAAPSAPHHTSMAVSSAPHANVAAALSFATPNQYRWVPSKDKTAAELHKSAFVAIKAQVNILNAGFMERIAEAIGPLVIDYHTTRHRPLVYQYETENGVMHGAEINISNLLVDPESRIGLGDLCLLARSAGVQGSDESIFDLSKQASTVIQVGITEFIIKHSDVLTKFDIIDKLPNNRLTGLSYLIMMEKIAGKKTVTASPMEVRLQTIRQDVITAASAPITVHTIMSTNITAHVTSGEKREREQAFGAFLRSAVSETRIGADADSIGKDDESPEAGSSATVEDDNMDENHELTDGAGEDVPTSSAQCTDDVKPPTTTLGPSPRRTTFTGFFSLLAMLSMLFTGTAMRGEPPPVGPQRVGVEAPRRSRLGTLSVFGGYSAFVFMIDFFLVGIVGLARSEPGIALAYTTTTGANLRRHYVVDSGCSRSGVCSWAKVYDMYLLQRPVRGDGISGHVDCYEAGELRLDVFDTRGHPVRIVIPDVLYNQSGNINLLSVGELNKAGYSVNFTKNGASGEHEDGREVLMRKIDGLFRLCTLGRGRSYASFEASSTEAQDGNEGSDRCHAPLTRAEQLHPRTHAPITKLVKLRQKMDGVDPLKPDDLNRHRCRFCDEASATRKAPGRASKTEYKEDADGWCVDQYNLGEETRTVDGNRYVYVFVMLYSRYIMIELTPDRQHDTVMGAFQSAILKAGPTPRFIRTDNGGEFIKEEFKAFCTEQGIRQQFSNPYSQHQNGVAEAAVGKLVKYMRGHMTQSNLDPQYWGFAVRHAVDVGNLLPHRSIDDDIPILRRGIKPYLDMLCPFGSSATVYFESKHREHGKLSASGKNGIFLGLGLTDGSKGYIVHSPNTDQIWISKNVTFDGTGHHHALSACPVTPLLQQLFWISCPCARNHAWRRDC